MKMSICACVSTRADYEIHYCPESVLVHFESVSEGRFKFEAHSAALFRQRWSAKARPDDLNYYIQDGLIHIDYYANYLEFRIASELGVVKRQGRFRRGR